MVCSELATCLTTSERCSRGLKDDSRKQVISAAGDCVVLDRLCVCKELDGAVFLQEMQNVFSFAKF